jgi:rhomboid family GlyGly-CTERM serine protease
VSLVIKIKRILQNTLPPAMIPSVALTALMTLIQALPFNWQAWIIYERVLVSEGQVWRLLTSNFIHLGWGHLIMNACGLLAMAWLFAEERDTSQWGIDLMICSLTTGVGLYLLNPEVLWCVGLSGALHGLFVIGAVSWVVGGIGMGKWLLVGICGKLAWEQTMGEMPFSGGIVGGSVVTDAHLWGAIGGLIAISVNQIWRRLSARL